MVENRKKPDKSAPLPLYYQVKTIIKDKIEQGDYKSGCKIEPERELAKYFDVSRMTLRKAITQLVDEGYLIRRAGEGTFVRKPKFRQGLLWLTSFTEDMKNRGLKPDSRTIFIEEDRACYYLADKLNIEENTKVIILKRLRKADGEPMCIEKSHIPKFFLKSAELTMDSLNGASLYDFLQNEGIYLNHARETLEAGIADQEEAGLLEIQIGAPVIYRERTTYNSKNTPVEFVNSTYRADRYKFYVELMRKD